MDTLSAPNDGLPAGDPRVAALIKLCMDLPLLATLLHLFHAHPTTLMTAEDIAYHLEVGSEDARLILDALRDEGLLRRAVAAEVVFYGLTGDKDTQEIVNKFEAWCEQQRRCWGPYLGTIHAE